MVIAQLDDFAACGAITQHVHCGPPNTAQELTSRLGFTDYYHEFFYPYYREESPDKTRDEFISAISLTKIADYLRSSEKITVMHNADDVILEPGEIDFFRDVFGDRATIYPHGGHCGNMNYRDNVAHMLATFTAGGAQ